MKKMIHLYIVVENDNEQEQVETVLDQALTDYHWDITDIEEETVE